MIIHFTLVISIKQKIHSDLGPPQSKSVESSKSCFKAEFTCGRSSLMVELIDILLVFGIIIVAAAGVVVVVVSNSHFGC